MLRYYDRACAKKNGVTGFSWLGFFLAPMVFGHHRLWKIFAFFTVALLILSFSEELFSFRIPSSSFTAVCLTTALGVKSLILMRATQIYNRLRAEGLSEQTIAEKIQSKGKPTVGGAFLALLIFLLGTVLFGMVLGVF